MGAVFGDEGPAMILGLQPAAMLDHIARVHDSILDRIPGERNGSQQVVLQDLEKILTEVNSQNALGGEEEKAFSMRTVAGGSVANTIRGLTAGFGISTAMIGACGDDKQGEQFVRDMRGSGVDLSRLRKKKGSTGQCACLVDGEGNRTMRPCLAHAVKLQAQELTREDFKNSKWLIVRYNSYNLEVIRAAIKLAKEEGLSVSMDLASFEMVRDFRKPLLGLLEDGLIDLCFANEDEGRELLRGEGKTDPESAVAFLSKHCRWAVVTLGPKGCVAKQGRKVVRVAAVEETQTVDGTGAGDLFASGFIYGLIKGLPLEHCCKLGACSGASVVRSLGGDVRPENWLWAYKQMLIKGLSLPTIPS